MTSQAIRLCECGCHTPLTGKQKRFSHDSHRVKYWSGCRRSGALGRGLDSLLPEKPKGKIHAAPVIGNPRLEPLLMALIQKKTLTSQELHSITGGMAIHSDIAEIRAAGYPIGPAKYKGKSESGRKIYEYSYLG